jgi:hypothetical protein
VFDSAHIFNRQEAEMRFMNGFMLLNAAETQRRLREAAERDRSARRRPRRRH